MLADTVRTDRVRLQPLRPDSAATVTLRRTVRAGKDLVAARVAMANQLRAYLQTTLPGAVGLFRDIDSPTSAYAALRAGRVTQLPSGSCHGTDAVRGGHMGLALSSCGEPEQADGICGRRRIMQARVGDRLRVHGRTVGHADHLVEIVEVRGVDGGPPFVVRYADGHTAIVFPGPDAVVERRQESSAGSGPVQRRD